MAESRKPSDPKDKGKDVATSTDAEVDPLYLHPSDYPGMQLAYKFSGEGFLNWTRNFKVDIIAKSKVGFIDRSVKREDYQGTKQASWDKANGMVKCWIFTALKDTVR